MQAFENSLKMEKISLHMLLSSAAGLAAVIFMGTLPAMAQTGVRETRPANDKERLLTMEEAVYTGAAYPEKPACFWSEDGNTLYYTAGDTLFSIEPATGAVKAEVSGSRAAGTAGSDCGGIMPAFPSGAENVTPGSCGRYAYTLGKSLYIGDSNGNSLPVAVSGDEDITYGQFTSRNEFGITEGIFWSPNGRKLAFYRKDESLVGSFPLLDITTRTGSLSEIKYPMAGMPSENVRLGIFDLASLTTVYVKADDYGYDQYLTNVTWSPDGKRIFIQVLDRSQKNMKLNMYDAESGDFISTLLEEHDSRYVEPQDRIWFLEGRTGENPEFIYRTCCRDGYWNLYLCGMDGKVKRITRTDADVAYIGNDGRYVYYTSAEVSPSENHLFKTDIRTGRSTRLTFEPGWHEIAMSPDCRHFADTWSSLDVPYTTDLRSADGKLVKRLFSAADPADVYAWCETVLGTVKSADGKYDNWYRLIKPKDFDPSEKYPVILYVYGGPHSQLVKNTWNAELRAWEMYMAQRGYIVYVQDNRGTLNQGAEYEKAIWRQCGQAEMADQMEGIRMLMSLPYVDCDRIGVHGWSYGGFMTISLITNYPDIFKVAVAGGPVIDWKWYEVMYGERYMDSPAANPEGYARTSLIAKAGDLKGKLLICQGAVDNVVVWEHSLSFIRECIKNNVQVDYFPYPCARHNVMGKDRVHLMDKVTMYFEDYL